MILISTACMLKKNERLTSDKSANLWAQTSNLNEKINGESSTINSDSLGSVPACVPMGRPSNSSELRIIGSKIRVDIKGKLDLLHVLAQFEVTSSGLRQFMLTLQELMFLFPVTIKRSGNNLWTREAGDLHNGLEPYHAAGAGFFRSLNSVHNDLWNDQLR